MPRGQQLICCTQGHFFREGSIPIRGDFIAGNTAHQNAKLSIFEEVTLPYKSNLYNTCCGSGWGR